MSLLAALAKSLALIGAATAGSVVQRTATLVMAYLLVAGLCGVGIGFLTFSGYQALVAALGSVHAALIVGCAYLVAGLVATVILQSRRR